MAKLSDTKLRVGRAFLEAKDVDGLVSWARHLNIPTLDLSLLSQTFEEFFKKNDMRMARWQFNHYFNQVDPEAEWRKWRRDLYLVVLRISIFAAAVYWFMFWIYRGMP